MRTYLPQGLRHNYLDTPTPPKNVIQSLTYLPQFKVLSTQLYPNLIFLMILGREKYSGQLFSYGLFLYNSCNDTVENVHGRWTLTKRLTVNYTQISKLM